MVAVSSSLNGIQNSRNTSPIGILREKLQLMARNCIRLSLVGVVLHFTMSTTTASPSYSRLRVKSSTLELEKNSTAFNISPSTDDRSFPRSAISIKTAKSNGFRRAESRMFMSIIMESRSKWATDQMSTNGRSNATIKAR